jgi:hypothetical protein
MSTKNIGGAQRYDQLANANRPHDEQSLARECSRLRLTGLTPRDIATALRLDIGEVLELLREGARHA